MTKKIQNLKPDTVLKNYWNDNERFADLFNAALFEGERVIKPEELGDMDTEEGATNYRIDYNVLDREGDVDMCTVFEETWIEGKIEGEAKGIVETGIEFGISQDDILARLQNKLNVSIQKAQEYFKMFGEQTV